MRFRFQVGDTDKHEIECSFNQFLGKLVIRLDRQEIHRRVRIFNEPLQETYQVRVQDGEPLDVLIEKERWPLFGHRYRVFLGGRLYKAYAGL